MMATILGLLLLVLAGSGLFVAAVLGVLGYSLATFFSPLPLIRGLGEVAWSSSADFILVAVPMFIMMGELLLRSGVTDSMYEALDRWVGHIPGGLMHTNIAAGCGAPCHVAQLPRATSPELCNPGPATTRVSARAIHINAGPLRRHAVPTPDQHGAAPRLHTTATQPCA